MARPPARNIILIVFDYMGYGDMAPFGAGAATPNIARLAAAGAVYTDAYAAAPICGPSRAALMTGLYPRRLGLESNIQPGQPGLPTSQPTLPRRFADAGFRTGLSGKWHLGYTADDSPNAHGFDHFLGFNAWNIDYYSHRLRDGGNGLFLDGLPVDRPGYTTDLFTDDAIDFISAAAPAPFFLYLSFNAMLPPYAPPGHDDDPAARDRWQSWSAADYRAAVAHLDHSVGRIEAALRAHDLTDHSLLAITCDHGGAELADSGAFSGGFASLREGGLRVPLILSWPAAIPAGQRHTEPVMLMDLTATLLAAANLPADGVTDGHDLFAGEHTAERDLLWRIDRSARPVPGPTHDQWAVRRGTWKFLHEAGRDQLFDLASDPGESRNLSRRYPALTGQLRDLVMGDWPTVGARA